MALQTALQEKEVRMVDKIAWFDDRFYELSVNGEQVFVPSVTTILNVYPKPELSRWRGDVGNDVADQRMWIAAERGTRIHKAGEMLSKGAVVVLDGTLSYDDLEALRNDNTVITLPNQEEFFNTLKIKQLLDVLQPEILLSEQIVYNVDKGYAGTLDWVWGIKEGEYLINGAKPVKLESGNYIVDLKTGKHVGDEAYMQLAAYAECPKIKEMDIIGGIIVHTTSENKKGIEGLSCKLKTRDELDLAYQNFEKILAVYEIAPHSKPKIFTMPKIISWDKN